MVRVRFDAVLWFLLGSACAAPPSRTADSPGIAFPTTLGEGSPQAGKEPRAPRPGPTVEAAEASASSSSSETKTTAGAAGSSTTAGAAGSSTTADGASSPGNPPAAPAPSPPDPEPLRTAAQWQFEIASDAGVLSVASVKRVDLRKPIVSARRMGRYAIELWIGSELVERVRFDLPLLSGTSSGVKLEATQKPLDLEKGAHVRTLVMVPRAERARRAVLVDRATNQIQALPWPPDRDAVRPPAPKTR
jgi:hypothetical protein